ncbi:MAG: exodeoxyribonuclease VII small subunit [Lachnospiraceae bacterium]|nr:exodeoxyribonuclease VII small subunit [Lachnospiraceae bacterium]
MKKQTLEDAFAALEEVIARLESEEISLEESFQAYSEGMELLQFCNASIDTVEKKVLKMNEDGGLDEF